MKLSDEKTGNESYFRVLLDPGSFSNTNSTKEKKIVSYITKKLANDINKNEIFRKSTTACNCKPATTSTAVGCFVTSNCITLTCKLLDH